MPEWFLPVLSMVVSPLVGYLVFRWQTRDLVQADQDRAAIAKPTAEDVLRQSLATRDAELAALRAQQHEVMTNHLEHDRQERDTIAAQLQNVAEILSGVQSEQKVTSDSLGKVCDRLDVESAGRQALSERVARLEGRIRGG